MAMVPLVGGALYLPRYPHYTSVFTSVLIDATGEKVAIYGPVWTPNQGAKSIRKVGFRFGAVTKTGGSGLTVSLQDVDLANGPAARPDGTPDQTVAIANGNASFAANTWILTGNLSADRAINHGDLLAVVIEYDGSGRLGSDLVNIALPTSAAAVASHGLGASHFTASWAYVGVLPGVLFEFSDGTLGCMQDAPPLAAINTHAYHVNTGTADEYALEFQVPWACQVDGAWAMLNFATGSDVEMILYDGTTAMTGGTVTIDANPIVATGNPLATPRLFSQAITLAANTTYRLAVRPTTTNVITTYSAEVASAATMATLAGGTAFKYSTRLDQGAWAAATDTRRLIAGIRIIAIDTGAGGGGIAKRAGAGGGLVG